MLFLFHFISLASQGVAVVREASEMRLAVDLSNLGRHNLGLWESEVAATAAAIASPVAARGRLAERGRYHDASRPGRGGAAWGAISYTIMVFRRLWEHHPR